MKYNKLTRRLFLQGTGNLGLSLPFLPSLIPRIARAEMQIPPRYLSLFLPYGPVGDHWWPDSSSMAKTKIFSATGKMPDYEIAHKNLPTNPSSGISYLFDQKFNPYLNRMTFLRGLDSRGGGDGHYGSLAFGNPRTNAANKATEYRATPTIDHIMAYADNFYPNGGDGFFRQIVAGVNKGMNSGEGFSFGFTNSAKRSGEVVHLDGFYQHDPQKLFDAIFGSFVAPKPTTTPIVDQILTDFHRVRNGRKIGSEDKVILENHIDLLAQLEKKLSSTASLQCTEPKRPPSSPGSAPHNGPADSKTQLDLISDVIFAAFRCQLSRVASLNLHFHHYSKLHIHTNNTEGFPTLKDNQKWGSDNIVLNMIQKMDSFPEGNGKTMLDNSLVYYTAGSGPYDHSALSRPCLLFGSAGGAIKTGQYVDYRLQNVAANYNFGIYSTGLLQNQLFSTIFQSMGLSKSQYSMANLGLTNGSGVSPKDIYSDYRDAKSSNKDYRYAMAETIASEKLPLL